MYNTPKSITFERRHYTIKVAIEQQEAPSSGFSNRTKDDLFL